MKKTIGALALVLAVAGCSTPDKGPKEEEMKTAVSKILQVPETKITKFKKGKCHAKDKGFVCGFELYLTFGEEPTKQALDKGYFYKSDDGWVMELAS